MIYRLLFLFKAADGLFFLAVSAAAYHHTSAMWLWYAIYLSAAIAFFAILRDLETWCRGLCTSIQFHAKCIRDKHFKVQFEDRLDLKADVRHYPKKNG